MLNLDLMKNPVNWLIVPVLAWVGLMAISFIFGPQRREKGIGADASVVSAAGQSVSPKTPLR